MHFGLDRNFVDADKLSRGCCWKYIHHRCKGAVESVIEDEMKKRCPDDNRYRDTGQRTLSCCLNGRTRMGFLEQGTRRHFDTGGLVEGSCCLAVSLQKSYFRCLR